MCEIGWNFFDGDFFKDLISALIGTGTALFIFYLTLRSDRKKALKEEKDQNNKRLDHLSNLVTATKNQIESSISNLKENISKFENDNLEFHLLVRNPNSSLERLEEILRNENYFLAYIKNYGKKNLKRFNNISLQTDFFIEQERQIWEMKKSSQQFDYERKQNFADTVNNLMNRTAQLLEIDLLDKKYKIEINRIFQDFYDNIGDRNDLNFYYDRFVRPIMENVLKHNLSEPYILELISEFKGVSNLFTEIKLQNDQHNMNQKAILERYEESLNYFIRDSKELIIEKKSS